MLLLFHSKLFVLPIPPFKFFLGIFFIAQKLLHHSDIKTTMAYLGIKQEELDEILDTLND